MKIDKPDSESGGAFCQSSISASRPEIAQGPGIPVALLLPKMSCRLSRDLFLTTVQVYNSVQG